MSRYRGVVLSQFKIESYPGAVSRLYYHKGVYTCCVVQRGVHVPDTEIELTEIGARTHYELGTCYRPFPEEEHHGHDQS